MTEDGLAITADFPGGNGAALSITDEGDAVAARFMPDPHGGPEVLWFHLRIDLADAHLGRPLRLTLENTQNMLGGNDPSRMRPVLRQGDGDWERLGPGERAETPDGRVHAVWELVPESSPIHVAYCYPYDGRDLAQLPDVWHEDTIGLSHAGRPLVRLSNSPGEPGSDRPGLYVLARQHAAETPGSWVLDGFLRATGEIGEAAPLVWAVPFTDIDGVEQGDYGKDNFPYDLNRAWGQPPMRHETLVMQRDIHRWRGRCKPVLAIDFHAPGACEWDGAYTYLPKPAQFPEQFAAVGHIVTAMGDALTDEYAADPFSRTADYASRWETLNFTAYMSTLGIPSFTLETPYALAGDRVLTREGYREIGCRMAVVAAGIT